MFPEMTSTYPEAKPRLTAQSDAQYSTDQLVDILAGASTLDDLTRSAALETNREKYRSILSAQIIYDKESVCRIAAEHGCSPESVNTMLAIKYPTAAEHAQTLEMMGARPDAKVLQQRLIQSYQTSLEQALQRALPMANIESKVANYEETYIHYIRFYSTQMEKEKSWKNFFGIKSMCKTLLGEVRIGQNTDVNILIELHKPEFTTACPKKY
jgi:hypothetical protein